MWSFNYFSNVVSDIITEGPQQIEIDQKENRAPSKPREVQKVHGVQNRWLKRAQKPKKGQKGKLAKIRRLKRVGKTWFRVSNCEYLCIFKLFEIISRICLCLCVCVYDATRHDAMR